MSNWEMIALSLAIVLCLLGCSALQGAPLKEDEEVIFFDTVGALEPGATHWRLPVRGWVFEPEQSALVRSKLLDLLGKELTQDQLTPEACALLEERGRPFMVDNERGKTFAIWLGDKRYSLGKSEPNGHFQGELRLPVKEVEALAKVEKGVRFLSYRLDMPSQDRRQYQGRIQLVEPRGLSIISDIDDTVKITEVLDKKATLLNTFCRPLRAIPGMPELYTAQAAKGVRIHFVSSSPWQLYAPLSSFLAQAGFPPATLLLKDFRWVDTSFFNLFEDPQAYKLSHIEPLLQRFPQRRFVLVGDSGEKDPEIYAAAWRKYPHHIQRIFIRDVTGEGRSAPRYQETFKGIPAEMWDIFSEPAGLMDRFPSPDQP